MRFARFVPLALGCFPIFQEGYHGDDERTGRNYFDAKDQRGKDDARKAIDTAFRLSLPKETVLYFAVDWDFVNDRVTDLIIPYFKGVHDYMRFRGNPYRIGVYGPRNICSRVSDTSMF